MTNLNTCNAPNQNSPSVDVIPTGKYAVPGCWYYGESIYGDNIWHNSWDYQFDNGNVDFQLDPNGYMAGYYLATDSDSNPAVPYCNMG